MSDWAECENPQEFIAGAITDLRTGIKTELPRPVNVGRRCGECNQCRRFQEAVRLQEQNGTHWLDELEQVD